MKYTMYKYNELFGPSNFPRNSKYYCDENKKVVGKMKYEYDGKSILKFVGLNQKRTQYLMKIITKRIQIKDIMHLLGFKNFIIHYFKNRFLDIK